MHSTLNVSSSFLPFANSCEPIPFVKPTCLLQVVIEKKYIIREARILNVLRFFVRGNIKYSNIAAIVDLFLKGVFAFGSSCLTWMNLLGIFSIHPSSPFSPPMHHIQQLAPRRHPLPRVCDAHGLQLTPMYTHLCPLDTQSN